MVDQIGNRNTAYVPIWLIFYGYFENCLRNSIDHFNASFNVL